MSLNQRSTFEWHQYDSFCSGGVWTSLLWALLRNYNFGLSICYSLCGNYFLAFLKTSFSYLHIYRTPGLPSGSKNISSDSDDLCFYISSYISEYISLMFRSLRLFKYILTFLFSRQKSKFGGKEMIHINVNTRYYCYIRSFKYLLLSTKSSEKKNR